MTEEKLPFYKGLAKAQKPAELSEEANRKHLEVKAAFRTSLEHARAAGIALAEAKRILGRRGKWGRWRARHFKGSAEAARGYVRIARNWDDPRLEKSRVEGFEPKTIDAFLKLIRNQKESTPKQKAAKDARAFVRRLFSERLAQVTDDEVLFFRDTFDYLWDRIYAVVQNGAPHPAMYLQLIRNRHLSSEEDAADALPEEGGSDGFWRGLTARYKKPSAT